MSTPSHQVILLSEDSHLLNSAKEKLQDVLDVWLANFESECEHLAIQHDISLVAIDARIANNRGLEICKHFKSNQALENKIFIILSDEDDIESKIRALAFGCDRFIHYPTQMDELPSEMMRSIDKKRNSSSKRGKFEASLSYQDLVDLERFFDICFRCQSLKELADTFLNAIAPLTLDCCLCLSNHIDEFIIDGSGELLREDRLVLKNLLNKPEVNPLGFSLSVSFTGTSVIVRSMPVGNIKLYDHIKQIVTIMLHALSLRVQALEFRSLYQMETGVTEKLLSFSEQVFSQLSFESMANLRTAEEGKIKVTNLVGELLYQGTVSRNIRNQILDEINQYSNQIISQLQSSAKLHNNRFEDIAKTLKETFAKGTSRDRALILQDKLKPNKNTD